MQTRHLGQLWPVSELTLGGGGVGQLWGATTQDECIATVRAAVDNGITLLDMDDLRAFAAADLRERRNEIERVADIINEELDRHISAASARELSPLVSRLRLEAEAIRQTELHRHSGRLSELTDEQREAVESLTKGIVAKLLHDPTVNLKDAAGTARGARLADAAQQLFDL